ncbi:MAG: phosphopantetheine adenylyltransferase [Pseudomonadota bacterium]
MKRLAQGLMILAGIIHLLPLSGVLGAERLASLYAVELNDPNVLIMMQHRAVLFGLLGVWLIVAAFRTALQLPAIIAGLISAGGFIVIALWVGDYNAALQRIVYADIVAIACLVGAWALFWLGRPNTASD